MLDAPFLRIARKEIFVFFSSPVAFVFLATFLAVNLFIFFWVEAFFARNIADVRPLFDWMPLLLIFLVAALTMRMWSEEKRMGTLEFVLTVPVSPQQFVAGKALACMALIGIALLLTLPIPLTVAHLGQLDWGPVIGAYIATLFLSAAYIAIGLFISARTESQIVSLIVTALICYGFYLIGSDTLTKSFNNSAAGFLSAISTRSRFESITRGVIDFRDIFYYISVFGVFISLNLLTLEKLRWSKAPLAPEEQTKKAHGNWHALTTLCILNFILGNFWLNPINSLRTDLTEGNIYSISSATKNQLAQLQEPLLIRGYFSQKTHPLLAPLVPQLKDLITEYEIASKGQARVEFIDPASNPELEDEANSKYGIKPVPFQISGKYEASLVNAYFDILIQYGDEYEVLNFQDLIEVKQLSETELDVKLRNPEYDLTSAIKKSMNGFQTTGDLFATIKNPIRFTGYISNDATLPEPLQNFKQTLTDVLQETKQAAQSDLFSYEFKNPSEDPELAQELLDQFGFRPMTTSLFSDNQFYFYLTLEGNSGQGHQEQDDQVFQIALPEDLESAAFRRNLEATLKRFSVGFTKVVTLVVPEQEANPYNPHQGAGSSFQFLEDSLSAEYSVEKNDLFSGRVPASTDLLAVLSPNELKEQQVFAIDQYLMQGGTVLMATAPFDTEMNRTTLRAKMHESGVTDWLVHHGISFEKSLVLDPQNVPFPIPVTRQVQGFTFQEMRQLDYPYFIDVRSPGLNQTSPITNSLNQVTMSWASPMTITPLEHQSATPLLQSSPNAWLSDSLEILPNLEALNSRNTANVSGFEASDQRDAWTLASMIEGKFTSYFKDQSSPLLSAEALKEDDEETEDGEDTKSIDTLGVIDQVLDSSTESAKLIVFASNQFLNDQTIQLLSSAERTLYNNSLQLIQNTIDWSLEDRDLLSIRSRGHFSRTLPNLQPSDQKFYESINYGFMFLGLLIVFAVYRYRVKLNQNRFDKILST